MFPAFERAHVVCTTLAHRYALQLPTAPPTGLGFRRMSGSAHPRNEPSIALARRPGFRQEGVTLDIRAAGGGGAAAHGE